MYHSVLVGQDTSLESRRALEMAIWISSGTGAHVTLVHLYGRKLPSFRRDPIEEQWEMLAERKEACRQAGLACTTRLLKGWTGHALVREAMWYDLLVVGKRGKSGKHRGQCGSLTSTLLLESPVPVLVADEESEAPERLLVALDATPDACRALRIAATLASERGLVLHIGEMIPRSGRPDHLERANECLEGYSGLTFTLETLIGPPAKTVLEYVAAHDIQLTFLPALAAPVIGPALCHHLAAKTHSSVLVPCGRVPPLH